MEMKFRNQDKLVKMLDVLFPGCKLYLFGSYARGDQKVSSDVDVAIDAGRRITAAEKGQAMNIIEALNIPQKIDLVDLNAAIPQELKDAILREGIVWQQSRGR